MDIASIAEIRKELKLTPPEMVLQLCLRLTQYKKENKEYISYLLFDSSNEALYVAKVKEEIKAGFSVMNKSSYYLAKKTIRKVLRSVKKYIKYSGNKETEVDLLLFFCQELNHSGLSREGNTALNNLYERQKVTIKKALAKLHEDLQYDYQHELEKL